MLNADSVYILFWIRAMRNYQIFTGRYGEITDQIMLKFDTIKTVWPRLLHGRQGHNKEMLDPSGYM